MTRLRTIAAIVLAAHTGCATTDTALATKRPSVSTVRLTFERLPAPDVHIRRIETRVDGVPTAALTAPLAPGTHDVEVLVGVEEAAGSATVSATHTFTVVPGGEAIYATIEFEETGKVELENRFRLVFAPPEVPRQPPAAPRQGHRRQGVRHHHTASVDRWNAQHGCLDRGPVRSRDRLRGNGAGVRMCFARRSDEQRPPDLRDASLV